MTEITITNKHISSTTTQFTLTDTTNNIIMVYECSVENIDGCHADVWVEVTENINGITTKIAGFYIDDGVRLYESVRGVVEYALKKYVKEKTYVSLVNWVTLTYVRLIIDVTQTIIEVN